MLDNILNIVKEVAANTVNNNADVPSEKKDLVVDTATDAISKGLINNIGSLSGLLGGKGGSNAILDTIQKSVVGTLVEKTGLNPGVANGLISTILPAVIGALKGKIDDKDSGFSLDSVLGALGQSDKKSGGAGGILGAIGKLFG